MSNKFKLSRKENKKNVETVTCETAVWYNVSTRKTTYPWRTDFPLHPFLSPVDPESPLHGVKWCIAFHLESKQLSGTTSVSSLLFRVVCLSDAAWLSGSVSWHWAPQSTCPLSSHRRLLLWATCHTHLSQVTGTVCVSGPSHFVFSVESSVEQRDSPKGFLSRMNPPAWGTDDWKLQRHMGKSTLS